MAKMVKPKEPKTLREYKKWRNAHFALKSALVPTAMTPFAVELIANWGVWFPADKDGSSVAIGLVLAIVTTLMSVLAVVKKDSAIMKKIGPFVSVSIAFIMWGAVCIFLANVLLELGKLLVFSGCGIIGAAVEDAIDKRAVEEKYLYMKGLADEAGFTKKGKWQNEAKQQAEYDADKMKQEYTFVPHD